MGQVMNEITPELREMIAAAPLFFVATAPLSAEGHVNVSPKGHDTLRVLDSRRIAYLDLTGSGNETAAHVAENTRMTVMICAFSGKPRIVRLYCKGRVIHRTSAEWRELAPLFPVLAGARQILVGDIEFVQTSCGFAVPEMAVVKEREALIRWAEGKGEDGLVDYRRARNRTSIDGIPAPPTDSGETPYLDGLETR
ncbi:MAG TPA: pyridoxamine 5'-phosphate oxidase family protein [Terriglobia bacterium]|nr:pyridoxamine 5'-phosphate oxidase family protein [Terriglobia bacterium]